MKSIINVNDISIKTKVIDGRDYSSLTDIAKFKNADEPHMVIANWMRTRTTIDFLGKWEELFNPHFNPLEFEGVRKLAGENSFTMSPQKWIQQTSAIGIISTAGKYGGTYAQNDIAMQFAAWLSPEFHLYIIKEFERLKQQEKQSLLWTINRIAAKKNYKVQTDAIKRQIDNSIITDSKKKFMYATEADMLNVIIFGKTAKQWEEEHPELAQKNNIRDFADMTNLIILSNLETLNALFLDQNKSEEERYNLLVQEYEKHKQSLSNNTKDIKHISTQPYIYPSS